MNRLRLTVILLFTLTSWAFSQQGSISVESKVDRAKISIGDRIIYSIIVTRGENFLVEMPQSGTNLGAFEILAYNDPKPEKVDGKIVQVREFTISTFDVGEYYIPPVTVRFTTEGDTVWQQLSTETIKINVESLKPSEEGDIKDIKAPYVLEKDIKGLIRLISIIVIIIAIIVLTIYFIKRRRAGKGLLPKIEKPPRPCHEIALENLDKLASSDLLAQGEVKLFYIKLSDIIRTYIERRFQIIAHEMTTYQLLGNMKQAQMEESIIQLSIDFFETCDLAKFAKHIPTEHENLKAIEQAYDFINSTKIVEKEPEQNSSNKKKLDDIMNSPDNVVTDATVKEVE